MKFIIDCFRFLKATFRALVFFFVMAFCVATVVLGFVVPGELLQEWGGIATVVSALLAGVGIGLVFVGGEVPDWSLESFSVYVGFLGFCLPVGVSVGLLAHSDDATVWPIIGSLVAVFLGIIAGAVIVNRRPSSDGAA